MIDRKSFEPMYQQIKRDIEQQILSGEIKIGDKLMSETEMLEHYHVARMTVRAALTELVNNGCLANERGRGTFCVALPRQEKKSIDVLLDTGDNYFTPYFLSGISRVLDREGYQLVLNDTRDTVEMFEKLLQQIISRGTSGIIIQPYRRVQDISEELLRELESCQAAGIPVVTIDGKFRDQDLVGYMTDDVYGGKLATEHLIAMGHRKILGLFRSSYRDSVFRTRGYCRAMEEHSLTPQILDADGEYQPALQALLQSRQITAIVCYNDLLAVDCHHFFAQIGVRVPEDVSVIGYDDTALAVASLPQITSVTHPKDIMGEDAADCLLQMLRGETVQPRQHLYQPKLIERQSVARL